MAVGRRARRAARAARRSSCRSASRSSRSRRSATSSTSTAATSSPTTLEKFAVYLSFFPHLVAGPIVRPASCSRSSTTPRDPRRVDTSRAFYLIATGLFKKVVIANYLASIDRRPGVRRAGAALVARDPDRRLRLRGPDLRDFSGYTDIAIGIALLLGFRFPQNFDSPYAARLVQDFWRRWHMTLSRWLRDYLYIPLGGNRGGNVAHVPQPDAHDAARRALARRRLDLRRLGRDPRRRRSSASAGGATRPRRTSRARHRAVARWRGPVVTFHFVCFAWIFFRADSFDAALGADRGPLHRLGRALAARHPGVLLAIAVGIGSQYLPARVPQLVMARFSRLPGPRAGGRPRARADAHDAIGPEGVAPFIYFRF